MYIFVRESDKVIVGYATRPVDEADMKQRGNLVFEIDKSEFSDSMLGQKLTSFDQQ
jgi:hypothetical protein